MRRTVYALIALAIIGPIVAFMVAYVVIKVPQPSDLKTNQVATIFAQDGKTQLARLVPFEGNRTDVTISDVPTHVRFAVLSAEDRTFYSNPGFSVSGTARAALNDVTGGDRQGGSTITQQYVKNALTGDDQTLTRKLKELVTSTKLARQTSKDDILAAYLNTIYFGRGSYGIAAAAKTYFGKSTKDLSVAEGAVLAASIRSPSALDPTDHPEAAQQRWT
ncbi:MAG: transglycosylase domain-containing protein, partial [Actinomycetota bacterium]|nr:transglycosylase domain-containing protein [Actinomycetota bacterium]